MQVNVDFAEGSVVLPRAELKEMLSVSMLPDGRTKVRVNSSSIGDIQGCLRKAKLSLFDRWVTQNESPATLFGSAIHKALEVFYRGALADRVLPAWEQIEMLGYGHDIPAGNFNLILRSIRAFVEKAAPLSALPETDKRSIPNGVWILSEYFKSFIHDPYVAHADGAGSFVEREFSFLLHEDPSLVIEYFGTIDLVVRNTETGDLIVADHKTSSVVGSDFYNRLKPNHQYTGYLMGAQRTYGIETNNFLINCIQVKEKPKTARGPAPHFPRQITTRDEADYQEFTDAVIHSVRAFLEARATGIWPIGSVNSCAMYGGCTFLSVCSAPASLRENILNAKFNKGKTTCS